MPGAITLSKLCELLDIAPKTAKILFTPANPGHTPLQFPRDMLNARLAECASGFPQDQPPTIESLEAGELAFCRVEDTLALLPQHSYFTLMSRAKSGEIAHVELSSHVRRFSIASVLAAAKPVNAFSTAETCYILGVMPSRHSWSIVRKSLVRKGLLATAQSPTDKQSVVVPRDSLAKVLADYLLPPGGDAEAWIAYRRSTFNTPQATALWSTSKVGEILCLPRTPVMQLIDDGALTYIWAPGRTERWVTPDSVWAHIENQPAVQLATIALCFDAPVQQVVEWQAEGAFTCTLPHAHPVPDVLYEPCFRWILRQKYLPTGAWPNEWLFWRHKGHLPLYSEQKMGALLGLDNAELKAVAKKGVAKAILTPAGDWRFTQSSVSKVRERLQQPAK